MNIYGVIMAGGGGTRFWPLSREDRPKQFLNLSGKDTLVNETIDRLEDITDKENVYIVTNERHVGITANLVKDKMDAAHILGEPEARNTADCIGYAAMEILTKRGDGIMCVLPSDHFIKNDNAYKKVLKQAIRTAEESDGLVTIGIKPTFPATGYGYIRHNNEKLYAAYQVREFVEKPDDETARNYVEAGTYLWNSGMFIWKVSEILNQFRVLLPDIYECLVTIGNAMNTETEQQVLHEVYPTIPKISVDYGIMERAKNVFVVEGDFGWNDVGSFDALPSLYEPDEYGNVNYGAHLLLNSTGCITYAKDKLITAIGVKDLMIVEADDAILICPKDKAQNVKEIVEALKDKDMTEYL